MDEKTLKPEIRFKGFTEAWEQRELGKIVKITMGTSPDGSTYSDVPSDYILIQGNADLKDGWVEPRIWTTQVTKTAEAGDLIMSVRAPAGSMGKTAYNAVIGRGVAAIKGNEFIFQSLVKMDTEGYWKKLSAGSTFDSLNTDVINEANINVPDVKEQDLIGRFLNNIDNLIALHQRKYEKLQSIKKGLLEKMFPTDGELIPSIRFKGFTEAWEQRKVSEIYKVTRGYVLATALTKETNDDEYKYPVYSSQTLNDGLMGYYKSYLFSDAITWTTDGANAGTVKFRKGPFYCTNVCGVLLSEDGKANKMMAEALNKIAYKFVSHVGNPKLMNNTMSDISFWFPHKVTEQLKISALFENLDNHITLHQRECEKLQNIKKALLQKMFC